MLKKICIMFKTICIKIKRNLCDYFEILSAFLRHIVCTFITSFSWKLVISLFDKHSHCIFSFSIYTFCDVEMCAMKSFLKWVNCLFPTQESNDEKWRNYFLPFSEKNLLLNIVTICMEKSTKKPNYDIILRSWSKR